MKRAKTLTIAFVSVIFVGCLLYFFLSASHPSKEFRNSLHPVESFLPSSYKNIKAGSLSNDGKFVAFIAEDSNGGRKLFLKPVDKDEITEVDNAWISCQFDENGTIWFDKKENDGFSIWKCDSGSQSPQKVIEKDVRPHPSSDGKWVAYRESMPEGKPTLLGNKILGLWLYDTSTKKKREIFAERLVLSYRWLPAGEGIIGVCLPSEKEFRTELEGMLESNVYMLPNPSTMGRLVLVEIPSFSEKMIDQGILARSIEPSIVSDGSVVALKQVSEQRLPEPPKSLENPSLLKPNFKIEFWKYEKAQNWKSTLLWQQEGGCYSFAISREGDSILFSTTDPQTLNDELWLVDLKKKATEKVSEGKEPIQSISYNDALNSFLVVSSKRIFLVDKNGNQKDLLAININAVESGKDVKR